MATWNKIRDFKGVRSNGGTTPLGGNDPNLRRIRRDLETSVRDNGVRTRGTSRDSGLSAQDIHRRRG